MSLTRELFDVGLVYVAALALAAAGLGAFTVRRAFIVESRGFGDAAQTAGVLAFATLVAGLLTDDGGGALLASGIALLVILLARLLLPRLTVAGAIRTALPALSLIAATPWTILLLREHAAPDWLVSLAAMAITLTGIMGGFGVAGDLARQAVLTHRTWRRPNRPLRAGTGSRPKVSIHLPSYAEPPEVVIAVLDRLAALDYPAFEVIVCDNNTQDEALWRPIAQHCAALNQARGIDRFRFFHVSPLAGAKAGALNFCLDRMAPDAALVAVIDADYIAKPDFLSRLVGYFDDPRIGYVQTPHDYRGFSNSAYLRACYWEYMPSNKLEMPGVNEYGAAFTIGTMCLIRTRALEQAGRWAEWCLTEDSEVSVRLRELGLSGIYLPDTFGRGLIPETFEDYKKQRFRWTAGPVQQLCRHWRLFLPRRLGGSTAIGGWSKLLEVQRAAAPLLQLGGTVAGLGAAIAAASLVASGMMPRLVLPGAAWCAIMIAAASTLLTTWHRLRLSGCRSVRDMAMGEIARLSLSYIQMVGGVAGLSGRPLAWRRTPKFRAERSGMRALGSTLPETAIGLAYLILLIGALALEAELGRDLTILLAIGSLFSMARFFAAPAMALASEGRLEHAARAPDCQASRDALVESPAR